MFKQAFEGFEWTGLPLFALALFVGLFVLMVLRTYGYKTRRDYERVAALPLDDGNQPTEVTHE